MNGSFLKRHLFGLTFGLIALAYLILFARLPMDSIWISDEGNRILSMQSYALNGDKTLPDPLAGISEIPPGLRAYPKPYFIQKDGAWRSAYQLLYPWVASWFYLLLGNFGVQLIAVLGGLLTALFAGLLARNLLADDRRACLVMGLCAFGTPVLFYSGTFLETTCASAAALAALYVYFRPGGEKRESLRMLACGLLTGISILFREEGYIFAAGFGLAILLYAFSWKRAILFGTGAALAVIPLLIYNYLDSGSIFGMHHAVYSGLSHAADSPVIHKMKDYSFYLFLLCLPFWGQLNLYLPWLMLAGPALPLIRMPKLRQAAEGLYLAAALSCCGASLWCCLNTEHGGVFIFQSLLDHVPLFALILLSMVELLRDPRREIRFLTVVALAGCFLPPMLLNHGQPGMFWGGRHFLNVVPVLVLLSVYLLTISNRVTRTVRAGGWLLLVLSVAANLAGYGVLSVKRNFSAGYVREIAKPEYQVVLTDMFFMPEELAWISRGKCVLLLTEENSLDQARDFLRKNGVGRFHLLLGGQYRKISSESLRRTMAETELKPGRLFRHPMLGFFDCQLAECTFKPQERPAGR